jgi:nitroreductase
MITGDEKAPFIQIDCGAAAENIALAAESMNIGSNLMTSPELLFASAKAKEQKKELGIPDGYAHMCTVVLGYKDCENPEAKPRSKDVINYIK